MEDFGFDLCVILAGAAILSAVAVYLKQPIVIAYILCGILVGPWGLGWVQNISFIENISHLGITLLLFLAGLNLHPDKLVKLFKKTTLITAANCFLSLLIAFGMARLFGFEMLESLCIGLAMMFSSTILAVKLLPTTRLHHEKMGAVCIAILIAEDLLALAVLAFIQCLGTPQGAFLGFAILSAKLVLFIGLLLLFEQYVLQKVMRYVDRLHETLFVLGLAWCFGIATFSNSLGLFHETGAFFAGVVLARHAVSRFIAEELKPLRDFFLVLFFFSLGANLDLGILKEILLPAILLTALFVIGKPWIFQKSFILSGEKPDFAKETGIRLGQLSEFSLLVAILAFELGHIGLKASQLIQLVTLLTFVVSSYWVVLKYPTPIGVSRQMTKD
jgi:glutathione-regulated potassium-efflux system ancillary protein KefC